MERKERIKNKEKDRHAVRGSSSSLASSTKGVAATLRRRAHTERRLFQRTPHSVLPYLFLSLRHESHHTHADGDHERRRKSRKRKRADRNNKKRERWRERRELSLFGDLATSGSFFHPKPTRQLRAPNTASSIQKKPGGEKRLTNTRSLFIATCHEVTSGTVPNYKLFSLSFFFFCFPRYEKAKLSASHFSEALASRQASGYFCCALRLCEPKKRNPRARKT